MSTTSIVSTPLKYLDKAVNSLRDLGLMPDKPDEAPITALIEQVSDLDEEKALAIARTLSHTTRVQRSRTGTDHADEGR